MARPNLRTVNKHSAWEAVSALQKAIRRGELDNALYWAADLDLSGFSEWLWRRLIVITSEDVGPGWPEGPAVIRALYQAWLDIKAKPNGPQALFITHAVVLLCRAQKTRLADTASTVHWVAHKDLYREVPDEALDIHTARGKAMGRVGEAGDDHFFEVAAKVIPEIEDDEAKMYLEVERKLWKARPDAETERFPKVKDLPVHVRFPNEPEEEPEQVELAPEE